MKKLFALLISAGMTFMGLAPASAANVYVGGEMPPSGILTKAGSPYVITQPIIVPAGQTLIIEAGVSIIADPVAVLSVRYLVELKGNLTIAGTASEPVRIIGLQGNTALYDTYEYPANNFLNVQIDHAIIENLRLDISRFGNFTIRDSDFYRTGPLQINAVGTSTYVSGTAIRNPAVVTIERNALHNVCPIFSSYQNATIVFSDNYLYAKGCAISDRYSPRDNGVTIRVSGNTFNKPANTGFLFSAMNKSNPLQLNLAGNYWSTIDELEIGSKINDGNDVRGLAVIEFKPYLTAANPLAPKSTMREISEKRSLTKFKTCASLNKYFEAGISKSQNYPAGAKTFKKIPFMHVPGFTANKHLLKGKASVICPK
ncbi:hypothetical protein [Rhodoluna lacicola]|uniref:Right handed beta helix domain-containing protein n=1 Tax=Rhodoluna lacicola TaxID=529884 RepID=A0A060JKX7_9MICO|nr:hypothetical protein [Rhodoluna lacicola]AIC46939.1 hypothetical protein Rhola_00001090 [Rhodoluna lacicola]